MTPDWWWNGSWNVVIYFWEKTEKHVWNSSQALKPYVLQIHSNTYFLSGTANPSHDIPLIKILWSLPPNLLAPDSLIGTPPFRTYFPQLCMVSGVTLHSNSSAAGLNSQVTCHRGSSVTVAQECAWDRRASAAKKQVKGGLGTRETEGPLLSWPHLSLTPALSPSLSTVLLFNTLTCRFSICI